MSLTQKEIKTIAAIKLKQEEILENVEEIYSIFISKDIKDNKIILLSRKDELYELKVDAIKSHDQIRDILALDPENKLYSESKTFLQQIKEMINKMKLWFDEFNNNVSIKPQFTNPYPITANLPKINLKIFNGDRDTWEGFYQQFLSIVHKNTQLSNIIKFQYLISSLTGPALNYIKDIPILEENYPIALEKLITKFQDKRYLATNYLNKILNIKPVTPDDLKSFQNYTDILSENYAALTELKIEKLEQFILFHIAYRNLDTNSKKYFELSLANHSENKLFPELNDLLKFLKTHSKILQNSSISYSLTPGSTKPASKTTSNLSIRRGLASSVKVDKKIVCFYCSTNDHLIYQCPQYRALSPPQRLEKIKGLNLCINCLNKNHKTNECLSKHVCLICNRTHHTTLHITKQNNDPPKDKVPETSPQNVQTCISKTQNDSKLSTRLLATALIQIKDNNGDIRIARALLDSGAEECFITSNFANLLKLKNKPCSFLVNGIGNSVIHPKGTLSCIISPINSNEPQLKTEAIVVPSIIKNIPLNTINEIPDHIKSLKFADPYFFKKNPIDFLIGGESYIQSMLGNWIKGPPGQLSAFETIFGWCIIGKLNTHLNKTNLNILSTTIIENPVSDNDLQRFWNLDDFPQQPILDPMDIKCEQLFQMHHYREISGRYVVPLPFRDSPPPSHFYESFKTASICLSSLLKRNNFKENRDSYCAFIKEYEDLNHMTRLNNIDSIKSTHYFIPHHPVIRPTSTTTRLRVVFNASRPLKDNHSLNHFLLSGPKLQSHILDILLKFRTHPIAITADIQKMYRQILIRPEDRIYQNILWKTDSQSKLEAFQLNTVTYGLSSAPFLALRTLKQLSLDEGDNFPNAKFILDNDIFVDDIVTGASSINEALTIKTELINLLNKGQFELQKWSSNNPEFLSSFSNDVCVSSLKFDKDSDKVNILGLSWNPFSDYFNYHIETFEIKCTKRSILSNLSKIFDPLGLVSPTIFLAKIIIQEIWRLGLDWDDLIPPSLQNMWSTLALDIKTLENCKIPRLITISNPITYQIIGFCDASEKGYAACIYVRTCDILKNCSIKLLVAKTKVAPLKVQTIPRLELCGSLLLSKLLDHTLSLYKSKFDISHVFNFSDSNIVLYWLQTPPHLLQTFVAHRVVKINELSQNAKWLHIDSSNNPADCASRGCMPKELINNSLWWYGPEFLKLPIDQWPVSKSEVPDQIPEIKSHLVQSLSGIISQPYHPLVRVSSFSKLQRFTAIILRYINNLKIIKGQNQLVKTIPPHLTYDRNPLTIKELHKALEFWIRYEQTRYFGKENKRNDTFQSRSIQMLQPFVDTAGLIRVGGRLLNAKISEDMKHPYLLPKKSPLSKLLIEHYHIFNLHIGPRTLQSILIRKFWIISARQLIRSILSKCLTCIKNRPKFITPLMGNLPPSRVQQARPFRIVGTDFGGPFQMKMYPGKCNKFSKIYVCIFICHATKAVHLEAVSSLTTESFLHALYRFTSRRGICSDIYSDCGTNFVGANRYLQEIYRFLGNSSNQNSLINKSSDYKIKWHFNVPSGPHFGGLFEAGIKSTKHHLRQVIGDQNCTFEEYSTIFCRIEAILNSRPLCTFSTDPSENDILTPGHFLTLEPPTTLPEYELTQLKLNRLNRWQLIHNIVQSFWHRWHKDYLNTLQQRIKWTKLQINLKKGDLVLLRDRSFPPTNWRRGRIIDVHPGSDGIVRIVSLKTANGIIQRPTCKLVLLPEDEPQHN